MSKPQSRTRFRIFGVLVPLILGGNLIFNLVSFSSINTTNIWSLERVPSTELIDLYKASSAPLRVEWIYPIIEEFYHGSTLYIPAGLMDSLKFTVELLQARGRLVEVIPLESGMELSERDIEYFLSLENDDISTKDGDVYHFMRMGNEAAGSVSADRI